MAGLSKVVGILIQAKDEASAVTTKVASGIDSINNSAGDAASKVSRLGDETEKLGGKSDKVKLLADSLKALAASLVVKAFIDANVELQKFELGMTQVTGSTAGAAQELEYVRSVANRLGLSIDDAGQAWLGMSAATKGTALEGEGARVIFEAISTQFAVLGRSSADVAGALVQVQQGVSKGKFELEDLKSIAERMPGFFSKFADALGITSSRLFDLISQGKIGGPEFLRFAQSINDSLEGIKIDTFEANLARLRNSLSDAFTSIGQSGAFDVFTKSLEIGTAAIVGATQTAVLMGTVIEGLYLKMSAGKNFDFGEYLSAALDKAADKTRAARDAMLGTDEAAKRAGDSGEAAGVRIASSMDHAAASAKDLKESAKEVDASLKALGIDPKAFEDPAAKINAAFASLASSAAASGEQIVVGLVGALKNLPEGASVAGIARQIDDAFRDGKLSAEQYASAIALIKVRLDGASPSFLAAKEQTKAQAEETKKATQEIDKAAEAADKMRLELEKIASNERIKLIDARVQLNVAQVEADTKRIQAAFEAINKTIDSTGSVIGNALGALKDLTPNTDNFRLVAEQLEKENQMRREAFEVQKQLSEAQIANLRAQTEAMMRGQALIKIDGAGLQPHLEAFMWEILRAIQVRVNKQGLAMLLGSSSP